LKFLYNSCNDGLYFWQTAPHLELPNGPTPTINSNRNEILLYGTRAIDHMPGATPFKQEMTNRRYDTMNYEVVNRARAGAGVRYAVLAAGRRLRERIRAHTRRPLAEAAPAPSLQASDA
jgi:hypothetical protein